MSRPRLPSELHADFPKPRLLSSSPLPIVKMPSFEELRSFYDAHPEFENEGEYQLQCPFCGNELRDERAACCGEAGRAEWILVEKEIA